MDKTFPESIWQEVQSLKVCITHSPSNSTPKEIIMSVNKDACMKVIIIAYFQIFLMLGNCSQH